jgi:phosphoglycerate dehydrogenase-like enzyme
VALVCASGDVIDAEFMALCPDRRLVAIASTGSDSIDVKVVNLAGAAVTNSRGNLHETTADLAFGLILGLDAGSSRPTATFGRGGGPGSTWTSSPATTCTALRSRRSLAS